MDNPLSPAAKIIYLDEVDSTMLEARRMIAKEIGGVASGTVIRANYQLKGSGRISDRRWQAANGEGLLFTIIFSCEDLKKRMIQKHFSILPLLCGLAVSNSIETQIPDSIINIKWPNDVLVEGKKISGILCEKTANYFLIGIGINLNQKTFPQDLKNPACSLRTISGKNADSKKILQSVLRNLFFVLSDPNWKEEIEKRLYLKNRKIQIKLGLAEEYGLNPERAEGRLLGIDESGAVVIETSVGEISIINGEVNNY